MGTKHRTCFLAITAILASLCFWGCKENDPAPILAQDLGTEGHPLVLPPSTFYNVAVNKGQADWVPFREPGTKPEPAQDAPTGDSQQAGSETEDEIKTFIDDYNALSAEGDFDELSTYVVDSQAKTITAALSAAADVRTKIETLKISLSEKLGDQTDRVESILAKILISADQATGARLSTTSITVAGADETTATTTPGSLTPTLKFVVIDDAWYVEFPDLPDAETLVERFSKQVDSYDEVIAQLSDGALTAAHILTNMEEALAAEAKSSTPQDGEIDDGDESDDAPEEDVDDDVENDDGDADDLNGNKADD